MAGLFDTYKSPDEVKRDIRTEGIAQDRSAPTGWGAISSAAAGGGRMLAQGLGGQDPRVAKAQAIQKIQQDLMMEGWESKVNTPEFYKEVAKRVSPIDPKMAMEAAMKGAELERTLKMEDVKSRYMEAQIGAMESPKAKAQSAIGKLASDFKEGRISEAEYRVGIENMKKRGTKFTIDADGNITFEEGPGITGKVSAPTKKTTNDLQKDIVGGMSTLQDLDRIANKYKEDYLTYQGQVTGWGLNKVSKFGIPVGSAGKEFIKGKQAFKSGVDQFFNAYRKEITGAAAAFKELEMLKQSLFSEDMSPPQFEAAFDELRSKIQQQVEFKQRLLEQGIPVDVIMKRLDAGEWKSMMPQEAAAQPKIGQQDLTKMSDEELLRLLK